MTNEYRLSSDRANVQFDVVHVWLRATYWSPDIRAEVVREAIANSVVIGAFEKLTGRQVSFARAVTDYATFAWLCDVVVDEAHRGRGISHAMIEALDRHPRLQTVRRWLLATKDAHGLYTQHGYMPVDAAAWLERKNPPLAWQET